MNAKEMFEKLKYKLVSKNKNGIIYEFENNFICFELKFISLSKDEIRYSHSLKCDLFLNTTKGASVDIDLELNEAIQQQLKELRFTK